MVVSAFSRTFETPHGSVRLQPDRHETYRLRGSASTLNGCVKDLPLTVSFAL
jgi:hypothetical protein